MQYVTFIMIHHKAIMIWRPHRVYKVCTARHNHAAPSLRPACLQEEANQGVTRYALARRMKSIRQSEHFVVPFAIRMQNRGPGKIRH